MRVKIEDEEFSLFIDYDRSKLPKLSYKGKVKYFKLRVEKILINPLKVLIKKKIFNELEPIDGSSVAWFCIVSLICAGIEALGTFYSGKRGDKETFCRFMYRYMNPVFKNKKYKKMTYGECIREYFRNGLSHGFCIKKGGIEHFNKYFEIDKQIGLQMNPRYFLKDFLKAFSSYTEDLRKSSSNSSVAKKFSKRFEDIFIKGQ